MTSDGYTTFAYDATGREVSATTPGVHGVTHTYDGDLMRVKRVENGQTTLYLRSSVLGGAVVAEMNAAGGWTRGYVYGESGGLTAIQQPEGYVEWVTQDPVTKGQRITNASGAVTASLEFDPFGGETSKSYNGYRQPQKYTTYTRDSNGTDDAMHRRYSSYWSRFQQPDPYDGSYNLADPQSLNRYAYTQNDPVNFVDPSGLNMSWGVGCVSVDEGRTWRCDAGTSLFGGSVFGRVVETGYNPTGTREPRSPREPPEPTDPNPPQAESDLQRRQREAREHNERAQRENERVSKEFQDCLERASANKERRFNERIGATAMERLQKVYHNVAPITLDSLAPSAIGATARTVAQRGLGSAVRGGIEGVGFGMVYRTWRNSIPLFAEWNRINTEYIADSTACYNARNFVGTVSIPRR